MDIYITTLFRFIFIFNINKNFKYFILFNDNNLMLNIKY